MIIEHKNYVPLEEKLRATLLEHDWDDIILASAFITIPGADYLIDVLNQLNNQRSLNITLLVGVKESFSKPSAIKSILNYMKANTNKNITIKFLAPEEQNFHVKCYCFHSKKKSKMLVGSANLTDMGLQSVGELTLEIDDISIIEETISYLNTFIKNSFNWSKHIAAYTEHYNAIKHSHPENRPVFKFPKKKKLKPILKCKQASPKPMLNTDIKAGETVNSVTRISKEESEMVDEIFETLKETKNDISKQFYLLYYNEENLSLDELEERFPIGGYYDCACIGRKNDNWEIGSKRVICKIGATRKTYNNKDLVIFLFSKHKDKNAYCEYIVTPEIFKVAEELGIKSEREIQPLNKNMLEYMTLVKKLSP